MHFISAVFADDSSHTGTVSRISSTPRQIDSVTVTVTVTCTSPNRLCALLNLTISVNPYGGRLLIRSLSIISLFSRVSLNIINILPLIVLAVISVFNAYN
jgi:hypothetical protein